MSASPSSRGTKRAAPDASVSAPKRRAASAESAESLAANIAKAKELKLVATCLICLDPNRVASASCDTPQCVWGVCFKCHSESDGTQMPPSCVCKKPIRSQIPKLRKHRPMLQGRPNGCGCGGQIWQVRGLPDHRIHVCDKTTLRQMLGNGVICPIALSCSLEDLPKHTAACGHIYCRRQELKNQNDLQKAQRETERKRRVIMRRMIALSENVDDDHFAALAAPADI